MYLMYPSKYNFINYNVLKGQAFESIYGNKDITKCSRLTANFGQLTAAKGGSGLFSLITPWVQ